MAQNKTHALVHNGTPHDEVGYELSDPKVITGDGRAKCKCGWLSEDLPSGRARQQAYKRHIEEPSVDTEPTDDDDLIGEAPAEPTKAATKTATKAATKKAEPAAPAGLADPGDGEFADVTFHVTPTWLWPVLGRYGAYSIAESVKGVSLSHDDKARKVRVTGNPKRLEPLTDLIEATWEAVGPARKAWKKTDPEFRAIIDVKTRGWQTRAGNAERDFTRDFVDAVRDMVAKKEVGDTPGAKAAQEAEGLEALVKGARR